MYLQLTVTDLKNIVQYLLYWGLLNHKNFIALVPIHYELSVSWSFQCNLQWNELQDCHQRRDQCCLEILCLVQPLIAHHNPKKMKKKKTKQNRIVLYKLKKDTILKEVQVFIYVMFANCFLIYPSFLCMQNYVIMQATSLSGVCTE